IEGSQPEHKRCAYKLNPAFITEYSSCGLVLYRFTRRSPVDRPKREVAAQSDKVFQLAPLRER
ncbi:hypothetical protein, partial [Bifidobacterium longum]|uniref:hypothetical protein n=1 Tax=Bifidobacterium longum TaxID=216816 RepID=UPI00398CCA75